MGIFLLWILLSIVVGAYASSKKVRLGGFGGFFISLIFSPIIGFIAVALTKPDDNAIIDSGEMKKCPQCAELVKKDALVCRFCGNKFEKKERKVPSQVSNKDQIKNAVLIAKYEPVPKKVFLYMLIGFIVLLIVGAILKHYYPS